MLSKKLSTTPSPNNNDKKVEEGVFLDVILFKEDLKDMRSLYEV